MFDFPASPSIDQVYTSGGVSYRYNGYGWVITGSNTGSGSISVGDAPPVATDNTLWFETDTGMLWLKYNDGNTSQWVSVGGPSNNPYTGYFLPLSGGSLTGNLSISTSDVILNLNKASSGNISVIAGKTANINRWLLYLGEGTAESSNAGSNFAITRCNDAGTGIDTPLVINRASGHVIMGGVDVNPAGGAINLTSTTTGYTDQVLINAISVASSDCFIRTTGARIWGFGVKGTSQPGEFIIVDYTAFATRLTIRVSGQFEFSNSQAAPNFGLISNGGILAIGTGQTAVWDSINGAKGGCVSVMDNGGGAGSGGAVEFGALGGAWKFACIKAGATNGAGNGIGELQFWVRVNTGDVALTRKGAMASDGVWYNTNASWSAISDRSMKENIDPYTNGLAAIKGLQPVNFSYIKDSPFADGRGTRHIGLVAQDAKEFVPEFVGEYDLNPMSDDPQPVATLSPGLLVFTLINAVKEMAAEIESLKQQIGAV